MCNLENTSSTTRKTTTTARTSTDQTTSTLILTLADETTSTDRLVSIQTTPATLATSTEDTTSTDIITSTDETKSTTEVLSQTTKKSQFENIANETIRKVVETIDVSIDPTKIEEREKKTKESIENYEESFGSLDMDKSYEALFELLWYSQMPCFDVKGLTSEAKDEISFLKRCFWKENPINCTAIFQQRPTDQGMCCTFNMEKANKILKDSKYTKAISFRQDDDARNAFERAEIPHWYSEGNEPQPEAGRNKGLMLIVDGHSNMQSSGTVKDNFNGFVTLIDDNDKFPMVSVGNMMTRPGYENNIKVNAIYLKAKEEIRKYEPDRRNCFFKDEYKLEIHRDYSQFNCIFECETTFASKCLSTCSEYNQTCNCNDAEFIDKIFYNSSEACVPWFYPTNNETSRQMCDPWKTQKFQEIMQKQIPKDQCKHCLPDCTTVKYDSIMTYANLRKCDRTNIGGTSLLCALVDGAMNPAPWMNTAQNEFLKANQSVPWYLDTDSSQAEEGMKQFANKRKQVAGHHSVSNAMFPSQLKDNPFYDAFEKDIGILRIFFSEDKILKYVTKNRMSNFDFLSQIGGSLGLAMGISIISIIEIFYWFAFRLFK